MSQLTICLPDCEWFEVLLCSILMFLSWNWISEKFSSVKESKKINNATTPDFHNSLYFCDATIQIPLWFLWASQWAQSQGKDMCCMRMAMYDFLQFHDFVQLINLTTQKFVNPYWLLKQQFGNSCSKGDSFSGKNKDWAFLISIVNQQSFQLCTKPLFIESSRV